MWMWRNMSFYPNFIPGCRLRPRARPFQSAVWVCTVFPHQFWIVFSPILPSRGYCRLSSSMSKFIPINDRKSIQVSTHQKNTNTTPIAVPASRAAESTSRTAKSIKRGLYFFFPERKGKGKGKSDGATAAFSLTIVLGPEQEVLSPHNVLENESDNSPRNVVDRCRWRNLTHAWEDETEREYKKSSRVRDCTRDVAQGMTYGKLESKHCQLRGILSDRRELNAYFR